MRLQDAAAPIFARHETFHPRYGWFRKAYTTAATTEDGFTDPEAPVKIGVGKNMVRSIKFWGLAAKILTADPNSPNKRAVEMIPTSIGHSLFGPAGWDPFMEDPGTIWLLHWLLLAPPSQVPIWWLAFNELHAVEFDDEALGAAVRSHFETNSDWNTPSDSAMDKDTSIFVRTYSPAVKTNRTSFDDMLDCPFRELGLVTRSAATGNHRFVLGPKPTLPDEILAYAILDYVLRREQTGSTITLAKLANEPGAPGRAFKLTETDIYTALETVSQTTDGLELLAPTGAQQLVWTSDLNDIAVGILNRYYDCAPEETVAGPRGDEAVDPDLLPERSKIMQGLEEATKRHSTAGAS